MMHSKISSLLEWIARKPKQALIVNIMLLLVFVPGALFISTDYGVKVWFRSNDSLVQGYNFLLGTFGNDDSVVISLDTNGKGVFSQDTLNDILDITEELRSVPDVVRVESLTNYQIVEGSEEEVNVRAFLDQKNLSHEEIKGLKEEALKHENMPGLVVSRDANAALFNVRLKPTFLEQPNHKPIMDAIEKLITKYSQEKGYSFYKLGTARVTETFRVIAETDLFLMIPILNIFLAIMLFFVFKSVVGVAIPFVVISLTCASAMGLSGYFGIKLNNLSGMVPMILIAICIADSIHFMVYYRKTKSAIETLKKNFTPTFLTTISTSIGFFSLGTATLKPIADFGILCGIGAFFAWVFSLFGVVPLLEILKEKNIKLFGEKKTHNFSIVHFVPSVRKHKYLICLSVLIFTVFAGSMGMKNSVNSNPFNYFKENTEIFTHNQYFLKKYNGVNGLEFVVDSGRKDGIFDPDFIKKIDSFQEYIRTKPYTNVTYSFVDSYKHLNRALFAGDESKFKIANSRSTLADQFLMYTLSVPRDMNVRDLVSLDQRYLRVRLLWNIQDSKKSIDETRYLVSQAKEFGLDAYATGQEYLFQGMNEYVVDTYFKSIATSLVLIAILMVIVFKSPFLGFISLLPNIIPITIGAFTMYLVGKPIDVGTVLVASVCFGIAIDDTIHFLGSYVRNKEAGISLEENIKSIFESTGVALISTTLTLVGGFGVFVFASFIPNFNFGVFSALVLFLALLVDLIFLPALFFILKGSKNA